jgi:hypothetical protein
MSMATRYHSKPIGFGRVLAESAPPPVPPKPERCNSCSGDEFWALDCGHGRKAWRCGHCHPQPDKGEGEA